MALLTAGEAAVVRRWRERIMYVPAQEMLQLALVHDLLSAIGAAPHLARPNLPAPASHYPAGVQLALLPFGEQALRHFMVPQVFRSLGCRSRYAAAVSGRPVPGSAPLTPAPPVPGPDDMDAAFMPLEQHGSGIHIE